MTSLTITTPTPPPSPPPNQIVVTTWSYSHFMYLLRKPFEHELKNCEKLLNLNEDEIREFINQIMSKCNELEYQMLEQNLSLRQNKIYIRSTDVDYSYPENYNFIEACKQFIQNFGIIVFDHLDNFDIINKFLSLNDGVLAKCVNPFTGDTIWHTNPFIIEMTGAELFNMFNFRGETPNDRHFMSMLFNFPQVGTCLLDIHNLWDENTYIYAEKSCDIPPRDPLSLSKIIRKQNK